MLHRFAVPAMACRFEVVLEATDAAWARSVAEEALAEVTLWHKRLNRFDTASDIARINRLAPYQPVRVDSELFELLSLCQRATRVTRGMFNPLLRATATRGTAIPGGVLRSASSSAANLTNAAASSLRLDPACATVSFSDPDPTVALDLGGIAKGWALDCAADSLLQNGVTLALLHGGTSSVRAIGTPPAMPGWAIQIAADPSQQPATAGDPPLILHLADESLSISAHHGRPEGHITHPGTGQLIHPRQHSGPQMAVATCRSAAWAEVWSTALLLDPTLCAHCEQNAMFEQARFAAVRNTCTWNVCSGSASGRTPAAISQLAAT